MKHTRPVCIENPPVTTEASGDDSRKLEIKVVYTGTAATVSALKRAHQCAQALGAHIDLLYWQVVPRFFDFNAPPVSIHFMQRQLCSMAQACCPDVTVEVRMFLCRHLEESLADILSRESLVILGGKKKWWHSREEKLANALASRGYMVLFVDSGIPNQSPWADVNGNGARQGRHVY